MSLEAINSRLFCRYSDADVFRKASAKFLFYIAVVFFFLMFALLFINVPKIGFLKSFLTSGTSCISALFAMFLIVKGRVRAAGTLLVFLQSSIILVGGITRSPELTVMTILFFAFPTIFLATVFSNDWVHIAVTIYLIGVAIFNYTRFSAVSFSISSQEMQAIMLRSLITFIITLVVTYVLAYVTMRSLKLSLKMSNDENKKSNEKNSYIMQLLDSIRKSYNDLTGAMNTTDNAVSSMLVNIQSEAATIKELVTSIEEVSASTLSIEQTSQEQNESVNELSMSISTLSELIDSLSVFGRDLQQEFFGVTKMAGEGKDSSTALNDVNRKTLANSGDIHSITAIIDDFFDKINLLSLNASIEAARAGDQGHGFAVVADEIGKLADISSGELKKIKDLTEKNRADVEYSSTIIEKIIAFIESVAVSLDTMQVNANGTLSVIAKQKDLQDSMLSRNSIVQKKSDVIKKSSAEQAAAIRNIAKSMESTNTLVMENTNSAKILRESYDKLKTITEELERIMNEKA